MLAIRVLNPCTAVDNLAAGAPCGWYDNPTILAMKRHRWYAGVEATGGSTIVILGGSVTGVTYSSRMVYNTHLRSILSTLKLFRMFAPSTAFKLLPASICVSVHNTSAD